MNPQKVSSSKAWAAGVALTGLALVAGLFLARANFGQNKNPLADQANQANGPASAGPPFPITGVPTDWTSQHVVFSATDNPGVLERIQHDPRYWLQQLRRHHGQNPTASPNAAALSRPSSGNDFLDRLALSNPVAVTGAQTATPAAPNPPGQNKKNTSSLQTDWNVSLGSQLATVTFASPAKFVVLTNGNPPSPPSCTGD